MSNQTGFLDQVRAAAAASWLAVTVTGSGNLQKVTNTVSVAGLADGIHETTVTLSAGNASNSPLVYRVTLEKRASAPVLSSLTLTPPETSVEPNKATSISASALDQYGSPLDVSIAWQLSGGGTLSNIRGPSTQFTSNGAEGIFALSATATYGGISKTSSAQLRVEPALYLISPAPGAVYCIGGALPLQWNDYKGGQVALKLSVDNGKQYNYLITETGSINHLDPAWANLRWTIPADSSLITATAQVLIYDYNNPEIKDGIFMRLKLCA